MAEWVAGAGSGKGGMYSDTSGLTARDLRFEVEVAEDNSKIIADAIRKQVKVALEGVGIQATADVAQITPVDTGRLRNSLTHALEPDADAVVIGTNVEYAFPVEKRKSYLVAAMNKHGKEYREYVEGQLRNAPEPH